MQTSFHRAALESMLAKVLYLITRLALPSMVLSQVGLAEYGLWSIAFVLVGYLGLSVSGLATVYVREIARAFERQDAQYANGMLSTGVALALGIGGLFYALLATSLPWILQHLSISEDLRQLAQQLILITCAVFLADLTIGAWGYVLHGLNRVHEQQRIWVLSFMLEWLIAALLLWQYWGINALLCAFVVRYAISIPLAWWRVHCAWPDLRLSISAVSRRHLSAFLQLGAKSQLSDSCAMLLHSADRLLAGLHFGSAATALIDLGSKLPTTAMSIASGISLVVLPRAACANTAELKLLYQQALRLAALSLLLLMPLLVACAPALILTWLGARPEILIAVTILLWVTPAWHLHILTGPASSALRAQGELRYEFYYHGLRAVGMGLSFVLSHNLLQFVAGYALTLGLSAVLYLLIASRRLYLSAGHIWHLALKPLLCCYSLAYLIYLYWPWNASNRGEAFFELCYSALLAGLLLLGLIWFLVLENKERLQIRTAFLRKPEVNHV